MTSNKLPSPAPPPNYHVWHGRFLAIEQIKTQEKDFNISKPSHCMSCFFLPSIHAAVLLRSIDRGGCIEGLQGHAAPTSQGPWSGPKTLTFVKKKKKGCAQRDRKFCVRDPAVKAAGVLAHLRAMCYVSDSRRFLPACAGINREEARGTADASLKIVSSGKERIRLANSLFQWDLAGPTGDTWPFSLSFLTWPLSHFPRSRRKLGRSSLWSCKKSCQSPNTEPSHFCIAGTCNAMWLTAFDVCSPHLHTSMGTFSFSDGRTEFENTNSDQSNSAYYWWWLLLLGAEPFELHCCVHKFALPVIKLQNAL